MGWFLQNAAVTSLQQTVADSRLRRLRVQDVIRPDAIGVTPGESVEDLIERYLLPGARRAMPVVEAGRLRGLVTLSDVGRVPAEGRGTTRVEAIMTPTDHLVTVTPSTPLRDAIDVLQRGDYEQAPVLDGERFLGLVTRADILRELQIREELGLADR